MWDGRYGNRSDIHGDERDEHTHREMLKRRDQESYPGPFESTLDAIDMKPWSHIRKELK